MLPCSIAKIDSIHISALPHYGPKPPNRINVGKVWEIIHDIRDVRCNSFLEPIGTLPTKNGLSVHSARISFGELYDGPRLQPESLLWCDNDPSA